MIMIAVMWLSLATQAVYGTVITINSNGSNTTDCCVKGTCQCGRLSSAVYNLQSNMVINITSNTTLYDNVHIKSRRLKNVTIAGNNATILCNNTGSIYCESCRNIVFTGITWYRCGTNFSNKTLIPALHFKTVSNVIIQSCTFQYSPSCPVRLDLARGRVIINESNFIANAIDSSNASCAGVYIYYNTDVDILVYASKFDSNGCRFCNHYSAIIFSLNEIYAVANVDIRNTVFSYNSRGLFVNCTSRSATVKLSKVTVLNNTIRGVLIGNSYQYFDFPDIEISSSTFVNNVNPLTIILPPKSFSVGSPSVKINDCFFSRNVAISNDDTGVTTSLGVLSMYYHPGYSVTIVDCHFCDNFNGAVDMQLISPSLLCLKSSIIFTNVTIYNTAMLENSNTSNPSVSITGTETFFQIQFTDVNFTSNYYSSEMGEMLLITSTIQQCMQLNYSLQFLRCTFDNNTFGNVVTLKIIKNVYDPGNGVLANVSDCNFNNNHDSSVVNVQGPTNGGSFTHIILVNSTFSNNQGTALYSILTDLKFQGEILFVNNTAISGAAIFFEEVHSVISDNAEIHFINNSAMQRGGALYLNLVSNDYCNVFPASFNASFLNNLADVAGNSIYFSIPKGCQISGTTSDNSSLLYLPNEFAYFQASYTRGSPVVSSPYSVELYPPEAIATHNSTNAYLLRQSKMLGEPVQITGSVLGHFNSVTEIVIFDINCEGCDDNYVLSTYQIAIHNESLIELRVFPTSQNDVADNLNISLKFLSVLPAVYRSITASLSVELSPCRIGHLFDKYQRQCICYPRRDLLRCTDDLIEIRVGYWAGYVSGDYTSSICPNDYCDFAKRMKTSLGFYGISRESDVSTDDQCNSHRTGVACGECKQGYTLAYDSTDCISNTQCSAGMTALVVILTILYWFIIVAIVFGLMHLSIQKVSALGYVFGVIYFYSIVDVLLVNDVYSEVYQLVEILSSFAKLNPRLFGQLCFVDGLSGIDQQFIHYFHALAISLILLAITLIARISPKLLKHFNRHIISVICILLLLAYTSLASTSLQLLKPLTFEDVDEVRTYLSPNIKYFSGRHLAYSIVALVFEVVIVIGLPLFLLLEPFLSRKVNFVRIKPLIDPFQQSYKNEYRWFAAYYLICRQVLILIAYIGNRNYYNMLYYLQTACIIIAMIHGYIQPCKSDLLNKLDGLILLIMVLVVNLNTFPSFSLSVSSGILVVLVILPLLLFCFVAIRNFLSYHCKRKKISSPLLNPAEGSDKRYEVVK